MKSAPVVKEPPSLDPGDIYFPVTRRAGQKRGFEPQFMASCPFRENSRIAVTVQDDKPKKFSIVTHGNAAWVDDLENGPALVSAKRASKQMTIVARSARRN
ncbi:hypothetical protein [Phyllobacterium sp. SB3]|uniref:hypothetical protein n=1 Tax=Phyllobacterium sp. SB3 TaxID=3156073 RepID=UPI0032AF3738